MNGRTYHLTLTEKYGMVYSQRIGNHYVYYLLMGLRVQVIKEDDALGLIMAGSTLCQEPAMMEAA